MALLWVEAGVWAPERTNCQGGMSEAKRVPCVTGNAARQCDAEYHRVCMLCVRGRSDRFACGRVVSNGWAVMSCLRLARVPVPDGAGAPICGRGRGTNGIEEWTFHRAVTWGCDCELGRVRAEQHEEPDVERRPDCLGLGRCLGGVAGGFVSWMTTVRRDVWMCFLVMGHVVPCMLPYCMSINLR